MQIHLPTSSVSPKGSLTRRTLINMTMRVAGVMLVSMGVSYLHVMSSLETETKQQLNRYITERGARESAIFQLAEDNLTFFRQQILTQFKKPSDRDFVAEFDRLYFPWSDKTLRNAPQNQPINRFNTAEYPTAFVSKHGQIDPDRKRSLMLAYDLVRSYGPAWSVRFPDTYFNTVDGDSIIYWKGQPLNLMISADLKIPEQEFFYIADPIHNPTRTPAWTGVYLDPNVKIWMVSAIVPIDDAKGKFIGTTGHDIILTDLFKQTVENRLPGTYNLIFRGDGRLIVHPELMDKIQESEGNLTIDQTRDPHLQRVFQQVKQAHTKSAVLDNAQDQEYLAVTQLSTTGWYFVTVYPKSLLSGAAFNTVKFFLVAGAIALLVETLLLFSVLKKQIIMPLKRLIEASNRLATGDFQIQLDTGRQDELGELADSFTSMAHQLDDSFQQLEQSNGELEQRINDRTTELQATLAHLQQTQLKMVQTEKMSALGQTVAGVAHEINNPVNFIHGNLAHIQRYSQDLLELVQCYQTEYPQPTAIVQAKIEAIDLDFLIEDIAKTLQSMRVGTNRIREIVLSLRNFSRLDESDFKMADLHEGIDSTLMILRERLQENSHGIEVIKEYGDLSEISCYPGPLNQVFMNIFANAIDALEGSENPTITIRTAAQGDRIIIKITDNGGGMGESVRTRIFDPFYTTKPVGKGTGLGLAVSYQIITEKHGGAIEVVSELGIGTEFIILLPQKVERLNPLESHGSEVLV
jgi:two-component system, NtrC family, sensor kinase